MFNFIIRKDIINRNQIISNQLQTQQLINLIQNAVIQQNNVSTLNSKVLVIKEDIETSILTNLEPTIMNYIQPSVDTLVQKLNDKILYENNVIKNDVYDKINYEINVLKTDISNVSNNVNVLKNDISNEVNLIKTDIYDIRNEINTLKNAFINIRDDLENLKNNFLNLEIDSNINTELSSKIEYLFGYFYHNESKLIMDNFPL